MFFNHWKISLGKYKTIGVPKKGWKKLGKLPLYENHLKSAISYQARK